MRPDVLKPDRLENCACLSVRKAARAVTRTFDEALAPSGLEATQFTVLAALAASTRFTMSSLAELLVMDRTSLTRNARVLVRAGYVSVTTDVDRRRRVPRLTAAGRRKLSAAFPLWRSAQKRTISRFGRTRFVKLLQELQAVTALA